jgi:hypothetical protein
MESHSLPAAPRSEFRLADAVDCMGALGRSFHLGFRGGRMGGLAPRALLRRRLSLRYAVLRSKINLAG